MICCIIDFCIEGMQDKMVVEGMLQVFVWCQMINEDDDVLMFEMFVEVMCNLQVVVMLIVVEVCMFSNVCVYLKKQFFYLSDEYICCCVEIIVVMIEGIIYCWFMFLNVLLE